MKTMIKPMTTDSKTNSDAEMNILNVEKSIVVNRTWKMRQTTRNWIKRILSEAT